MKIHSKLLSALLFSSLALGLSTGCGGGDKTSNNFTLPSTGTPGGGQPGSPVVTTKIGLTVKERDSVTTSIHKFNSFSSPCEISSTAAATEMNCLLNINEYDLFFYGVTVNENFPSSMCSFYKEYPYWHYKAPPGKGPAIMSVSVDGDNATVTACAADGTAGTLDASGGCDVTEGHFDPDGSFTCEYVYLDQDNNPINCCSGSYGLTTTTTAAGTTTSEYVSGSHGGKWGNCAESPAKDMNFERIKSTNLFKAIIYNSTDTVKAFTIPSSYSGAATTFSGNVYSSNFYGWNMYTQGSFAAAPLPTPLAYSADLSGTTITPPNVPYVFECLDSNREVKHRINLYINEWDTKEAFTAYNIAGSTVTSPNSASSDIEGVNCSVDSLPGGFCDDYFDWDALSNAWPFE